HLADGGRSGDARRNPLPAVRAVVTLYAPVSRRRPRMNEPILSAKGLHKRFGAVVAADDISVDIADGITVGIIGANGAGKTSFVNMVTGYLKPDRGQIRFEGADITQLSPRQITRLGVRRSFQVAQLFPNLTVRDNALVALAADEV